MTTPGSDMPSPPVTDGEHGGLVEALGRVPDPRNPRGIRCPLVVLLTVAVCAVLAGATSFAAIRGARLPEGRQVHLLSVLDTSTGIVLAQVTGDTKSNEIPAFTSLLDHTALSRP